MSRKITVQFNTLRSFAGVDADGEGIRWTPERNKEYQVTVEPGEGTLIYLVLPSGIKLGFLPPGESSNYFLVREGWGEPTEAVFPVGPLVKPSAKPILESAIILEIEPTKHSSLVAQTEYLIYKLPRILNGLLVDRGRVSQETVANRTNTEAVGELRGVASFMLVSRNNHLRYQCVSFRIDNKTTKKNLTKQYFCGSVCAS